MSELSDQACHACGVVNDAATYAGGPWQPEPVAGDVSICMTCAAVSIFTGEGLDSREPTEDERAQYLSDPEVMEAVRIVRASIDGET